MLFIYNFNAGAMQLAKLAQASLLPISLAYQQSQLIQSLLPHYQQVRLTILLDHSAGHFLIAPDGVAPEHELSLRLI